MLFIKYVLLLHLLLKTAVGKARPSERKTKWDDIVTNACARELGSYTWDTNAKGHYASICTYDPALGSWLYCTKNLLAKRKKKHELFILVFSRINHLCQRYYKENPKSKENMIDILKNATAHIQPTPNFERVINYPVHVNETSLNLWVSAFFVPLDNLDKGNVYGVLLCLYWFGILLVACAYNFLGISLLKQKILRNRLSACVRGYVTIPALFHGHQAEVGRWILVALIPTRVETLTLLVYLILHTYLLCSYKFDHNELVTTLKNQRLIFYSDRAGILAFSHFPLILIFAGRNNLLHWLTGIKFQAFIMYHKWLGRIMFIDCIIHAVGYTYHAFSENYWRYVKTSALWRNGSAGMIISGVIILFSFCYFRRHYYEIFLLVHISMGAGMFYACWEHCKELGWTEWISISLIFWLQDRLVRLGRILFFGFPLAQVDLCDESLLRVTVPKGWKCWNYKPGQYTYLYFLTPTMFWQAHPFTIMDLSREDNKLIAIISVKQGLTKTLKDYLLKNSKREIRVAVEGPYGNSAPIHKFEDILFLAGGTGVPGPLSMAVAAARADKNNSKSITLVWSLRNFKLIQVYKAELILLKELKINVEIYLTGKVPRKIDMDDSVCSNQNDALLSMSISEIPIIHFGRPDINNLIDSASFSKTSLLVVSCGSGPFVDKTREITAMKILEQPKKLIEYVEEFQTW